MKTSSLAQVLAATGYIALGLFGLSNTLSRAQAPAAAEAPAAAPAINLPPGASDVLKLTKAGLSEDVILAQVKSMGPVPLTADQIIYLTNAGVSQNVIKAFLQNSPPSESPPSVPVAPMAPPPPAPDVNPPSPAPGMPSPTPAPGAIAVPANVPWSDTGIDLASGQTVTLTANGAIYIEARTDPYHGRRVELIEVGPGGNPTFDTNDLRRPFVAPGMPAYSLVGRIGNTAPFEIGSRATFYSPVGGRLYLGVNASSFERNSGSWIVTLASTAPAAQPAPGAPPASVPPPASAVQAPPDVSGGAGPQVDYNYVHDQLAPYGNWVQVPAYGWAWIPAAASSDPLWRPYADQGQWVYTDAGFYWQSTYPWGDIAFHYGRWTNAAGYGWLWVPAYDWAPSWVAWRYADADGFIGWAPLPPSAIFVAGVGLTFNGAAAVNIDFGLPVDAFVFVGYDHFWDGNYRGVFLPRDRIAGFFGRSVVQNGYRLEGGHFVIAGAGPIHLGAMTHHPITPVNFQSLRGRPEQRKPGPQ